MHQTRAEVTRKLPIERKGTKYVARARIDVKNSVPVVVAVRDMLKLARTAKEVNEMRKEKLLKINGKEVKDLRDSIRLFNIFEADKHYVLALTKNGKFVFEETKEKSRLCKVINKKILKGGKVQINLNDGSNILSKEKINIDDSAYLDFEGKIKNHVKFDKGKECVVISGKYVGLKGRVESVEGKKAKIRLGHNKIAELEKGSVIVI
ncbi:KOW motif-containing protein [Candidatus Pacearchaeota archaeon]|nr:KOW motif-containing protein [Candidatus Pacearchaeota archaeon]